MTPARKRLVALTGKLRTYLTELRDTTMETHIQKETLAFRYGVKQHEVQQALAVLNLEGLVTQARHTVCHDLGVGKKKCWHPDVYNIVRGVVDQDENGS